ncbi:MAG: L,D-transpeptidase [Sporolactobacillus sp.]
MNFIRKGGCVLSTLIIGLNLASCSLINRTTEPNPAPQQHTVSKAVKKDKPPVTKKKPSKPIHWNQPSGGTYPKLQKNEAIQLDVSVKNQRVYVKDGDHTLYTMVISTGLDTKPQNSTPTGTYHIQGERGKWFYAPRYKEGAEYWVSWKNHGEFLFHSVPMDQNKKVIDADAKRLGHKDSHGCIHLTVPDAKWIYENIPFNTKVVIH